MYLTEDYNSPQSAYWALKAFIAIGLTENDPFWKEPELPYPKHDSTSSATFCSGPRQIVCNRSESHHFLLSSAQFTSLQWTGGTAKYCKFAYSSAFGFSVPTGQATLQQLAPDNMLVLSRDGTQTWVTKWKCREATPGSVKVHGKMPEKALPSSSVAWYPWEDRSLQIVTTLVAPSLRWPDWHIRIHKVTVLSDKFSTIHLAEGGFAIHGRKRDNMPLEAVQELCEPSGDVGQFELTLRTSNATLIASQAGASGIDTEMSSMNESTTTVSAFQPEANTNLMTPRTLIPLAEHQLKELRRGDDFIITSKVFAVSTQSAQTEAGSKTLKDRWLDCPKVKISEGTGCDDSDYIDLSHVINI